MGRLRALILLLLCGCASTGRRESPQAGIAGPEQSPSHRLPLLFWDGGIETAAALREAGLRRLAVPPPESADWRKAGFDPVPLSRDEIASRQKLSVPRILVNPNLAAPTRAPWVNANGWRVQRTPNEKYWYESPAGTGALAAAEAFVYGADAVLIIDPSDLATVGAMLSFLGQLDGPSLSPLAELGVVDDGSHATGEVITLLARRNLMFRVVSAPDPKLAVNVAPGTSNDPNRPRKSAPQFVLQLRDQLGDDRRLLRLFGSELVIGKLTGGRGQLRLHLLNYSGDSIEGLRVRIKGNYQRVAARSLGVAGTTIADQVVSNEFTEFSLSEIGPYAVVDLSASSGTAGAARVVRSRLAMGCAFAIEAYGLAPKILAAALDAALAEAVRLDGLLSHYKRDSALSRLNRQASDGPVAPPPELFEVVTASVRHSRASGGAFDATVGPLMKAWGFFGGDGRIPSAAELQEARARVGYHHVFVDATNRTVRFARPGVEIDLGGIGKGYAIERMVAILRVRGVESALLSAGGSTLYAIGRPPGRSGWQVTIASPTAHEPEQTGTTEPPAGVVVLRDQALSISGTAVKTFSRGGRAYSHIMDPRTGQPAPGVLAVAVIHDSATEADALDNALFVLGPEAARALIAQHPGSDALFYLPHRSGQGWERIQLNERSKLGARF